MSRKECDNPNCPNLVRARLAEATLKALERRIDDMREEQSLTIQRLYERREERHERAEK